MSDTDRDYFRLCSSCKSPLDFGATYYRCNVSTCNRKRMGLFFCSMPCWEAHLPTMRHREAWAEEERAPTKAQWEARQREEREAEERKAQRAKPPEAARPVKRIVGGEEVPHDVLIVVSKLKKYVKARSGMNTSDGVVEVLSDLVRSACDQAVRNAVRAERRTLLARDFED